MSYVNVKINNNQDAIVKIYKPGLKVGTEVIVESKEDLEYGIISKIFSLDTKFKNLDYSFFRFATDEDKLVYKENKIDAGKAFIRCRELINELNLPMKLISATYTFTREQLIFKFSSDSRVDFRKLAKELAKLYHTRIELRQVGVRDKAKEVGGCGQCGRKLCCKGFLKEFNSVSINMAKNQNIALNPNKINGICGRLLCCLQYEDEVYKECRNKLPKVNSMIDNDIFSGKVISIDPLNLKYKVMTSEDEIVECEINDSSK